eukprot:TRINITY_DN21546_c0_g1_i1.p1 TRINITY_DN21546_c0_g1~~TRINITY_DN21546_c0_g1_i1.p1  ORF type:complete len:619 (-),score=84.99 TRINITY_DN21546_c0_g1_i1:100-1956(-)
MGRDPEKAKDCPRAVEYILVTTCIIQLVIILVLLLWTPRCLARFSPRTCELLAACEVFFFFVLVSSTHTFYAARIVAVDPYLCFWPKNGPPATFSPLKIVLTWAIMQAAIHLFFPIRWIILLPFEVLCALAYGVLAVAPNNTTNCEIFTNWFMSVVLVVIASMGKRRLERHERTAMLEYISEKALRFQTEFKLGLMEQSGKPTGVAAPMSEKSAAMSQSSATSLPTSYYIFHVSAGLDVIYRLQAIQALGEKEFWLIKSDVLQGFPNMLLGRGGFGVVILGCLAGAAAAIKLPVARGEMTINDLANEIRMMRRVRHPNIVAFLGVCVIPEEELFMLVEEYVPGKSMKAVLKGAMQVSSTARGSILLGVCRALMYLHGLEPAVAHGDLKPANILVQKTRETQFHAKLIDFGLSRIVSPLSKPMGGTLKYMAPEVLIRFATRGESLHVESSSFCSSDMFSFGRVIYFAATSQEPLHHFSNSEILEIAREHTAQPSLDWPDELTPWQTQCRTLSTHCLGETCEARASARDLFSILLETIVSAPVGENEARGPCELTARDASSIAMPTLPQDLDLLVMGGAKDPVSAFREARLNYLGEQTKDRPVVSMEARNHVISHCKLSI